MNIANSGWYDAIIILLKSSFQIYNKILKNANILIHCSDGWDRTSQLCSMSQILLDKYYRTIDGFICLIEKDWLTFGHQFRYRCGMYCPGDSPSNVASENQKSPVFIQWLDAVYQIMQQNITKFEYNTDLLQSFFIIVSYEIICSFVTGVENILYSGLLLKVSNIKEYISLRFLIVINPPGFADNLCNSFQKLLSTVMLFFLKNLIFSNIFSISLSLILFIL